MRFKTEQLSKLMFFVYWSKHNFDINQLVDLHKIEFDYSGIA